MRRLPRLHPAPEFTAMKTALPARLPARGFTLIELMISIVVLAIIVAVALPSYQSATRKSRRGEAISALAALQQAQERYRSGSPSYASALSDVSAPSTTAPGGYYTLSIASSTATGYVITADGTGSTQRADGDCAKLSIEVTGTSIKYGSCAACTTFTYTPANRCWSQ